MTLEVSARTPIKADPEELAEWRDSVEGLVVSHGAREATRVLSAAWARARALGLVAEWAAQHPSELRTAWDRAKALEIPGSIDPLP
jgi:hypothetical protein